MGEAVWTFVGEVVTSFVEVDGGWAAHQWYGGPYVDEYGTGGWESPPYRTLEEAVGEVLLGILAPGHEDEGEED